MSEIVGRLIVGDKRNDQIAVVTVVVPAGGEMPIDPTWRFEGWLLRRKTWKGGTRIKVEAPNRINVDGDVSDG